MSDKSLWKSDQISLFIAKTFTGSLRSAPFQVRNTPREATNTPGPCHKVKMRRTADTS